MSRGSQGLKRVFFLAAASAMAPSPQAGATLVGEDIKVEFLEGADSFTDVVTAALRRHSRRRP